MLQKNDVRERLAKRSVRVDTGSSRADSHNFLPVRRSGLSEPRSRYAVLLHLEVQGLVVGSEVSVRCAPVSPGSLERLTDRLPLGIRRGRLIELLERVADRRWLVPECNRRGRIVAEKRLLLRRNTV